MNMVKCARRNTAAMLVVGLVMTLPGLAYSQSQAKPSKTDPGSTSDQRNLDGQLLEGLGEKLHRGDQPKGASAAEGNDAAGLSPENVLAPFAEGSDVGQQNPLVRIGRQMRRVEQLLLQRQVSVETQQAQRQIVDHLDQLIDALAASQQARRQRKPSASSQGDQQASKSGTEAARNASGQPEGSGSDVQQTTLEPGGMSQVWGHLPERLRSQMRSAEAVEFLPKYRKLIEEYYKRLAEDRGIQQ